MTDAASRPSIATDAGLGGLQLTITAGPARFVVDEPVALGGLDLGPTPHELVQAALASCTAQTLRLYANRKGWTLGAMSVEVLLTRDLGPTPSDQFTRTITLPTGLPEEQRIRLLEIADKCPIHRMLVGTVSIETIWCKATI